MKYYLSPSILACDLSNAASEIGKADRAGADLIHIDVMDGHFVDQITFGTPFIKSLRKVTKKGLDVHMMVDNPYDHLNFLKEAGADIVTVHIEADPMIHRTLTRIRDLGMRPAVAINPGTPVEALLSVLQDVDMVLVMSVDPGYGGQELIPMSLEKVKILRSFSDRLNIEVDGGVNLMNIDRVIEAGANVIVAGSAVFKGDPEENIRVLLSHFPRETEPPKNIEEGKLLSFPGAKGKDNR